MFGLIIRGVFLVGIVGWYSTSLWRMIDDYWKDQFKRYLDQEYERNPHMRDDVILHDDKQGDQPDEKVAGKLEIPVTDSSCSGGPELCSETAGAADSTHPREENTDAGVDEEEGETGKKKKEVARPVVVDDPAFQSVRGRDTENRPGKIRMEQDEDGGDSRVSQTSEEPKRSAQQKHRPSPQKEKKSSPGARRRRQKTSKKPPKIGVKTEEESRRRNPRRIPALVFTNQDFETYQREHPDREFEEFDEDDRGRSEDDLGTVRVEDLPFKPAVEIYDLARVSEEEYCPLTLDDDPSCEEIRPWPY